MNPQERSPLGASREEILIGRVTDGEATPADWQDLERLAGEDPSVWTRLALAQRRHAALSAAVDDALTVAELVPAPAHTYDRTNPASVRWRAYSGWAAAAVVALSWAGLSRGPAHQPAGMGANTAGAAGLVDLSALQPDELFTRYLDRGKAEGRVLGELPMVMLQSEPTADGAAVDVVYVRQVMERARVERVYQLSSDEAGRPAPIRVAPATLRGGNPL